MRVRSPSTICWVPGLPPGIVVGLEMTSGPLPGEPLAAFGVISCGVIVTETVVEDFVKLFRTAYYCQRTTGNRNKSTINNALPVRTFYAAETSL